MKPSVAYNARFMLSSSKSDSVPTNQICCVVYEFLRLCDARYAGRITYKLKYILEQHISKSIRKTSTTLREQLSSMCNYSNTKMRVIRLRASSDQKSRMRQNIYRS